MKTSTSLASCLSDAYRACNSRTVYLDSHAKPHMIAEKVRVFSDYLQFILGNNILDWGCDHAPDSLLLNHSSDNYTVHACDIRKAIPFPFSSRTFYAQVKGSFLPYHDESFDTVVGAGTFEHVPSEIDALSGLYRILKPGGRLILTHVPNSYSIAEHLYRPNHHRRYSESGIKALLLSNGFLPIKIFRYNTVPINRLFDSGKYFRWIDRIPIANWFCNTMTVISVRVDFFGSNIETDGKDPLR